MSKRDKIYDEYIRLGEPDKKERAQNWRIAIGLQQVDGLTPSDYLIETARLNIEGDISIDEVHNRLTTYYQQSRIADPADRTEEADKVSARIDEVLSERTFTFRPAEYLAIHRRLFSDVYKFAGSIRDYNISKAEWVLDGASVYYAGADSIRETLDYDFAQEGAFSYEGLSDRETVAHIARFVSGIWQIHPFGEGNTRATAVFAIKYLRTFAFDISDDLFSRHAWYFRNALVRANYSDYGKGVHASMEYLNRFFNNLLFGGQHSLRNRALHIAHRDGEKPADAFDERSGTIAIGLEEKPEGNADMFGENADEFGEKHENDAIEFGEKHGGGRTSDKILSLMRTDPRISAKAIGAAIGLTTRGVEKSISQLKKAGVIERVGAAKGGHWVVLR